MGQQKESDRNLFIAIQRVHGAWAITPKQIRLAERL